MMEELDQIQHDLRKTRQIIEREPFSRYLAMDMIIALHRQYPEIGERIQERHWQQRPFYATTSEDLKAQLKELLQYLYSESMAMQFR